MQRATLAGAAQACGVDTAGVVGRLETLVASLVTDEAERSSAMARLINAMKQAKARQREETPVPCNRVIAAYRQVPFTREPVCPVPGRSAL